MLICQCCAVTTILAITMTPVALDIIDFDLTRLPNVCKFDFGNGANRSMSLDFSLHKTDESSIVLLLCSVVMLSVAFTGSVTFIDLKRFTQNSIVCMVSAHRFHHSHAWRASVFVMLTRISLQVCIISALSWVVRIQRGTALRLIWVPTILPFVFE